MIPTPHLVGTSHFLAWEQEYTHLTWGGPRSIEMVRTHLSSGCCVLDAGCGNGRHLLPLSRLYRAFGVDVSPTAVKLARSYLKKSDRCAGYAASTITRLPFADRSFNGIVCIEVLQHLFDDERRMAVGEFRRVLVPGGMLFFEAPGVEDLRYGGEEVESHTFLRKNGIIYHYFTKEEVTSLFDGFEIVDIKDIKIEKRFRGKPYTHHRIRAAARLSCQNAIPR